MYPYIKVKRLVLWVVSVWALSAPSLLVATSKGTKRKLCDYLDCERFVVSKGLCVAHGGGRRCAFGECHKLAVVTDFCKAHGGGKRCRFEGCGKFALSGGACVSHGGGKRCAVEGCLKVVQLRGLCAAHGGGQRCAVEGCTRAPKVGGLCLTHKVKKSCAIESCQNVAKLDGLCFSHGGGKRCAARDCRKYALPGGFCLLHGEESAGSHDMPDGQTSEPAVVVAQSPVVERRGEERAPDLDGGLEFALGLRDVDVRMADQECVQDLDHFLGLDPEEGAQDLLEFALGTQDIAHVWNATEQESLPNLDDFCGLEDVPPGEATSEFPADELMDLLESQDLQDPGEIDASLLALDHLCDTDHRTQTQALLEFPLVELEGEGLCDLGDLAELGDGMPVSEGGAHVSLP
ncbi:MAG: hypothetical protein OXT67_13675 [Zetaproteobacteria bacterium]|nr:hypothetical protein [Zetaproteobacteria bacterium]